MSASQRQVFYACDADGHIVQATTIAMDDQSQIKDPPPAIEQGITCFQPPLESD